MNIRWVAGVSMSRQGLSCREDYADNCPQPPNLGSVVEQLHTNSLFVTFRVFRGYTTRYAINSWITLP